MTITDVTAADAVAHFRHRLQFETDVSDVHAALHEPRSSFVLIDTRSRDSWDQGHVPGALHLPTAEMADRAEEGIPRGSRVVTYCWGPGCNGAVKGALALAQLGYQVKEMLGGFEYWVREGFPVKTAAETMTRTADPLTAPVAAISCGC
jgi:rhodanese-related sulfurtransferase